MRLTILERTDARWIVLPSVLHEPHVLRNEGLLRHIARVDIDFGRLSDGLATGIALHGFGVAEARDELRLREAMSDTDTRADTDRI